MQSTIDKNSTSRQSLSNFNTRTRILMIDDNEADCQLIEHQLALSSKAEQYEFQSTHDIHDLSLQQLENIDICLLDYDLGFITGIELLEFAQLGSQVPIILLSGMSHIEQFDSDIVDKDIMYFLDKNDMNSDSLERTIRYALKHFHAQKTLSKLAFIDESTGLPNRRVLDIEVHKYFHSQKAQIALALFGLKNIKVLKFLYGEVIINRAMLCISDVINECFQDIITLSKFDESSCAVLLNSDLALGELNGLMLSCEEKINKQLDREFPNLYQLRCHQASAIADYSDEVQHWLHTVEMQLASKTIKTHDKHLMSHTLLQH